MPYWKFILRWIIFKLSPPKGCNHLRVSPVNPNHQFCPDCGKQVVSEWYIIRCKQCSSKRSGYHLFNEYIPHDKFCTKCGSNRYKVEIRDNIEFYEFSFATFKFKELKIDSIPSKQRRSSTKVWIDPHSPPLYPVHSAPITSFQLLPVTVST